MVIKIYDFKLNACKLVSAKTIDELKIKAEKALGFEVVKIVRIHDGAEIDDDGVLIELQNVSNNGEIELLCLAKNQKINYDIKKNEDKDVFSKLSLNDDLSTVQLKKEKLKIEKKLKEKEDKKIIKSEESDKQRIISLKTKEEIREYTDTLMRELKTFEKMKKEEKHDYSDLKRLFKELEYKFDLLNEMKKKIELEDKGKIGLLKADMVVKDIDKKAEDSNSDEVEGKTRFHNIRDTFDRKKDKEQKKDEEIAKEKLGEIVIDKNKGVKKERKIDHTDEESCSDSDEKLKKINDKKKILEICKKSSDEKYESLFDYLENVSSICDIVVLLHCCVSEEPPKYCFDDIEIILKINENTRIAIINACDDNKYQISQFVSKKEFRSIDFKITKTKDIRNNIISMDWRKESSRFLYNIVSAECRHDTLSQFTREDPIRDLLNYNKILFYFCSIQSNLNHADANNIKIKNKFYEPENKFYEPENKFYEPENKFYKPENKFYEPENKFYEPEVVPYDLHREDSLYEYEDSIDKKGTYDELYDKPYLKSPFENIDLRRDKNPFLLKKPLIKHRAPSAPIHKRTIPKDDSPFKYKTPVDKKGTYDELNDEPYLESRYETIDLARYKNPILLRKSSDKLLYFHDKVKPVNENMQIFVKCLEDCFSIDIFSKILSNISNQRFVSYLYTLKRIKKSSSKSLAKDLLSPKKTCKKTMIKESNVTMYSYNKPISFENMLDEVIESNLSMNANKYEIKTLAQAHALHEIELITCKDEHLKMPQKITNLKMCAELLSNHEAYYTLIHISETTKFLANNFNLLYGQIYINVPTNYLFKSATEVFIGQDITSFNFDANLKCMMDESVLQAFMHYTYEYSKKKLLVIDLRTVKQPPTTYILTEPIIFCSVEGKYGASNLGLKAINDRMAKHRCSALCNQFLKK